MRFFGLKSCDTCRKALKDLAHLDVTVIDVRADGVSDEDRAAIVEAFGAGGVEHAIDHMAQLVSGRARDESRRDPRRAPDGDETPGD